MHIGGDFSKDVVRGAEPSVGGHGVSPLTDSPAGTGGRVTGFLADAVVEATVVDEPVLATSCELPPPLTSTATPAMRTTARKPPAMARVRFCWRLRAAATAAWRACRVCRWRWRLSVGTANHRNRRCYRESASDSRRSEVRRHLRCRRRPH